MRKLLILLAIPCVFTFTVPPEAVYKLLKHDLKGIGVSVPEQDIEVLAYADMPSRVYGYSGDMGAHSNRTVCILINRNLWEEMSFKQKKLLILHESMHSLWEYKHCTNQRCVMSTPANMSKWDSIAYDQVLIESIYHHMYSR